MSVQIEEMRIDHYENVYDLWLEADGILLDQVDSKTTIDRFLKQNPGLSFIARDHDTLVGVVLCGHDGRRGYIDHLAVSKSHRRQGIGKALVARSIFNLIRIGITKWQLFIQEDNQDGIAFWTNLGWNERVELVTMSKQQVK